jgi:hypothetical protein
LYKNCKKYIIFLQFYFILLDKKMNLGTALIGLAITLGTIYVVAYVAGKGWEKGTK